MFTACEHLITPLFMGRVCVSNISELSMFRRLTGPDFWSGYFDHFIILLLFVDLLLAFLLCTLFRITWASVEEELISCLFLIFAFSFTLILLSVKKQTTKYTSAKIFVFLSSCIILGIKN